MGFADDYTQVKDRIPEFWERYPEGRILASNPAPVEIGGAVFVGVTVELYADRTDERPISRASSWEPFPGKTNFTRDSEMENAETSAIGRAMGALNIGIRHDFASADEVRNRQSVDEAEPTVTTQEASRQLDEAIAKRGLPGKPSDHAAAVWGSVSPRTVGRQNRIPQSELDRLLAAVETYEPESVPA